MSRLKSIFGKVSIKQTLKLNCVKVLTKRMFWSNPEGIYRMETATIFWTFHELLCIINVFDLQYVYFSYVLISDTTILKLPRYLRKMTIDGSTKIISITFFEKIQIFPKSEYYDLCWIPRYMLNLWQTLLVISCF